MNGELSELIVIRNSFSLVPRTVEAYATALIKTMSPVTDNASLADIEVEQSPPKRGFFPGGQWSQIGKLGHRVKTPKMRGN